MSFQPFPSPVRDAALLLIPCLVVLLLALAGPPALAQGFRKIETRQQFLSLVEGRRLWTPGTTMIVRRDGAIRGDHLGRRITGIWHWKDGAFCRAMNTRRQKLPMDCLGVGYLARTLRFTDRDAHEFQDMQIR